MLEDFQNHLDKEEGRRDTAEEQLHKASKNLVYVKAGVEHLADKLYHLKAVSFPTHINTNQNILSNL